MFFGQNYHVEAERLNFEILYRVITKQDTLVHGKAFNLLMRESSVPNAANLATSYSGCSCSSGSGCCSGGGCGSCVKVTVAPHLFDQKYPPVPPKDTLIAA